jgi:L-cystine uptake protein TcyP (sodium:dicarboxylate symporter family)
VLEKSKNFLLTFVETVGGNGCVAFKPRRLAVFLQIKRVISFWIETLFLKGLPSGGVLRW